MEIVLQDLSGEYGNVALSFSGEYENLAPGFEW